MEELANDSKYSGVNFLLVNMSSLDDAEEYKDQLGINSCPIGHASAGGYGIRYIPHRTLIGKDGLVIKNYEGFQWSDIDKALAASGPSAGGEPSQAEAEEVAAAFSKIDANNDGTIDCEELSSALQELDPSRWDAGKAGELFAAADVDRDGKIDYAEFSAWLFSSEVGPIRRALSLAKYGEHGGVGLCVNGCGRKKFSKYKTCCTRCKGPGSQHAHDCEKKQKNMTGPAYVGMSKIIGESLLRSDGSRVGCAEALSGVKVLGILFTATW
mmetsp:Transcript_1751/g.2021  ORF Transcript_1751/g.2021 Transcript_1751/m.2021 type:complete len:269 (-) Transcript_1751:865-1671(-)